MALNLPQEYQQLLDGCLAIARMAGQQILEIYHNGEYEKITKSDSTPVTSADFASNQVLTEQLKVLAPDIPIISEEMKPTGFDTRKQWQRYWLLDPLDGTQEFISRSGHFAVNIALVEEGWPTLGVIYWPCQDITYFAIKGHGSYKLKDGELVQMNVRKVKDPRKIKVAISRVQNLKKVTRYLNQGVEPTFAKFGSCALKSCMVAEGLADCYLRVGPTGEWDTGAPYIIVSEAGGRILDSEYQSLSFNARESLKNPDFFVLGDQSLSWPDIIKAHPTKREY